MIKMKKLSIFLVLALLIVSVTAASADGYPYSYDWDGKRGTDSENCELADGKLRSYDGWIHWVFSTKGASTDAKLVLGGTGSGEYSPGAPLNANVWHFYTPYFELEGLTATIYLDKDGQRPKQLVISDYCPGGFEDLKVTKTAVTSYTRTHDWEIDKNVKPGKIWLYAPGQDGKSSAGTATWTVDVTYTGHEDSKFNVSGVITIQNTGTLPAVITSVDDVLAGAPISVDCGLTFPYTLAKGETLTCTYSEDGKVEGKNEVTVTTEKDEYFAEAAIVWDAPTTEINKTVNIKDVSDVFDELNLGTITAPNNGKFVYTKDFAWADYDKCGEFIYYNEAKVIGDGGKVLDSAKAELHVYVQCLGD
jgi:hypothetical protein